MGETIYDINAFHKKNLTPLYVHLREKDPVARFRMGRNKLVWVLSRHEDVSYALGNSGLFSAKAIGEALQPEGIKEECKRDMFLLSQDGREHRRNRDLMKQAFTAKSVQDVFPAICESAARMISAIPSGEEINFINDFAHPYITTVTDKLLGTDDTLTQEEMDIWLGALGTVIENADPEQVRKTEDIIERQNKKFADTVARKKKCPGPDLISELIHAEIEGDKFSDTDLLNAVELIYVGGFHAQIQMLCRAMIILSRNPALIDTLKASPETTPVFIDEVLRYQTLAPGTIRKTTEDVTLHGMTIPAGETVICLISSANRDPDVFPDPDVFDITRSNLRKHLAFGYGPHLCLGRTLAREQMVTGVDMLLSRFNRVECPSDDDIEEHSTWMFRHIPLLPITFS